MRSEAELTRCRDLRVRIRTLCLSFEADDLVKIIEGKCYKMLAEIRDIIRDDSLDDPECFMKIDSIVSLFIREGISTGDRNDF